MISEVVMPQMGADMKEGDFVERDRELARRFGLAAQRAKIGRIIGAEALVRWRGWPGPHLARCSLWSISRSA